MVPNLDPAVHHRNDSPSLFFLFLSLFCFSFSSSLQSFLCSISATLCSWFLQPSQIHINSRRRIKQVLLLGVGSALLEIYQPGNDRFEPEHNIVFCVSNSRNRTIFSDAALDLGRELDLTWEVGDVQGLKSISLNDTKLMAMELMQIMIMKENMNSRRKGNFGGKKVFFFFKK